MSLMYLFRVLQQQSYSFGYQFSHLGDLESGQYNTMNILVSLQYLCLLSFILFHMGSLDFILLSSQSLIVFMSPLFSNIQILSFVAWYQSLGSKRSQVSPFAFVLHLYHASPLCIIFHSTFGYLHLVKRGCTQWRVLDSSIYIIRPIS